MECDRYYKTCTTCTCTCIIIIVDNTCTVVTGGKDTDLRLWNPYVSTKPITLLKGHTTAIMHVAIVHLDGLILSFSKDMVRQKRS